MTIAAASKARSRVRARSVSAATAARAAGLPTTVADLWEPSTVQRLARALAEIAAEELTRSSGPVRDPHFAERMRALLESEISQANMAAAVRELVGGSLHLCHPRFMAQQVAAPVPAAALVESVVAALNQSIAVWDMSPAGTMVDRDLIARFKRLFRYPAGADGSFVPGGSYGNLTALLAARAALDGRAWRQGGSRVAIVCGEQTHYSISRAAGILGLGERCVFKVATDDAFRTDPERVPEAFRRARAAGFRRFLLVGTSGSTPTGSCDDLVALHDIARRQRAWFHVDAAHGGGFALSPKLRRLVRGIERSDSIVFDPHKTLFMPLTSGMVLVRDGAHLRGAFEQQAPYLFGGFRADFPDIGTMTIACSQRFDALKTWLTWKAAGPAAWAAMMEGVCSAARRAYEYCAGSDILEPMHAPESNIFCFRLRRGPASPKSADRVHWELKQAVNKSGEAYISSTVLRGRRVLRIVVMNPRTTGDDAVEVMRLVERLSRRGVSRQAGAEVESRAR
jgi:L-2,4-diaminobutyrate decarboxylase